MKKLLTYTVMILCVTLIISVMPTEAEGAIYEDTVRLHILANSDTEEDQNLKLKLRDAILEEFSKELSEFQSTNEAKTALSDKISDIEEF